MTPTHPRVLIFIPAFNEAGNLPATIAELRAFNPAYALLVVDDGSTDGTAAAARALGVPVAAHPVNLGAGGAAQTAFRYALAHGFDIAVQHDADGQHDPRFIPALMAVLAAGDVDVAVGSRYIAAGGYSASPWRRVGIWFFSLIATLASGQRLTDVTSGQRAYDLRALHPLARQFPTEFPDAEALVAIKRAGLRVREIPVTIRPRRGGHSKTTLARALAYPFKSLLAVGVEMLRRPQRPPREAL